MVATSTAILISAAVAAASSAAVATQNQRTQKRLGAARNAKMEKLENQRRTQAANAKTEEQKRQQAQAKIASAEGNRLRGLQLDAKGIERRGVSGSKEQQTEQVLSDRRD